MERTVTLLTTCISSEDVLCAADAAVFAVTVLADAATSLDDFFGLLVVEFFLVADTTVVRTVVAVATFFLEFSFFTVLDFLLRFVLLAVFFAFFFSLDFFTFLLVVFFTFTVGLVASGTSSSGMTILPSSVSTYSTICGIDKSSVSCPVYQVPVTSTAAASAMPPNLTNLFLFI